MRAPPRNADIAIIGISCRFPGAASADAFWKNLCDGVESITFFSDQELVSAGVAPSLVANPDYVKAAAMLRDVEMFDASFFGYSPKDAALLDPQQRLFLEVCWEAFENAGYDPTGYPGKVGVLSTSGGVVSTYLLAKLNHADLPGQTASTAHINNDKDFLSTRVSFKLNLRGPSYTIQSACSSSLVAVHQACQYLRFGECDMMLAGGSVVRVPQAQGYVAEKRNLYSLDGHCRPFDAAGQGTIFGSGVGAVLLKPLEQAIADRDHIFAVIKGTAANNDGSAKISYTAPSLGQQSQAVVDALKSSGVTADSLGYVECHSTGTIVGDPLEIEALTMAFRTDTARRQYCAIASLKANIGHPEQAAGIAGIIKTALALHHKQIPPSINYEKPNPRIDFAASPFYVNTRLQDFPLTDTPRRAGLNSLGIGGTNAFAVLEEAPPVQASNKEAAGSFPRLLTLSAKSPDALVARVEQLLGWLNENPEAPIGDLCYTTNVSRSQFTFRFAAPARSIPELKERLAGWLRSVMDDASLLRRTSKPSTAFLFPGQGAQRAGMAAELYRTHSVFREAMDRCRALAEPHLEHDLLAVIFAPASDDALVNRTDYTQPALFAVEYALAQLLKSWGIVPDAVIGHSLGEIAAACLADVMTLEDAMRLVIARGALMQRVPGGGAMAAIFAEHSVVSALLHKIGHEITVAAMNGPLNTVVTGERDSLKVLSDELDRQNISYRVLRISNAFHSPRTDPILDDFESVAAGIEQHAPKLPLISNLTGELTTAAPDKSYWRRHLREPVRFGDGMLALARLEPQTFVEVGPHPVLLPIAQVCLGANGKSATWVAALNRQSSDCDSISEMLAALYLAGHNMNWPAVHANASWRRIPLPTYPFRRNRFWLEDDAVPARQMATVGERSHPLVGARTDSSGKELRYEARYGVQHTGYLSDHRVAGTVVLPTTAELEAATIAGRMHFATRHVSLADAMHHQAMSFANGEDRIVRVAVAPMKSDKAAFTLSSASVEQPDVWHTHMTGRLHRMDGPSQPAFSARRLRADCRKERPVAEVYESLHKLGLEYGSAFRGIREVYLGEHEALTKVRLPEGLATAPYAIHPAFLDACLHAYPLVLQGTETLAGDRREIHLPVSLAGYRCHQDGVDEAWVHTKLRTVESDNSQVVDIRIYDTADRPVAELEGLVVRPLPLEKVVPGRAVTDDVFYRVAWRKSIRRSGRKQDRAPASWLIFADAKGAGAALAARLEAAGHRPHLVYRAGAFARQGPRTWTVNERQSRDFHRLLEQFTAAEALPCSGVVYLWALDAPSIERLSLADLRTGTEMMCRGALATLHALDATRSTSPPGRRLWFVTTNSQPAEGSDHPVDPVQAPLWGLGRTIAIEHPGLWGGLIDLQLNGHDAANIELLTAELLEPDGETQVAITAAGQRIVPRFVRQSLAELSPRQPRVRGDATYLITGGLGMLGRSVAKWLIGKGARSLVVTGRHASAKAAEDAFGTAEFNGAAIRVVAADIGRDEDVSRLMQTISNELPPLRGVVQSAGVLDDGILAQMDWDRFSRLFEPRVYGSWLLHQYTRSLELDFFVFNSSLLSLLGSAGQGNYTASSIFLDSLTAHRRAAGLPATVLNWCAWSGGGLATISGARGEAMFSALGVKFITPDYAMEQFDNVMRRDVDQIAIAIADWPTYASKVGRSAFLRELLNKGDLEIPKPSFAQGRNPIDAPPAPANGHARQHVLSKVQQHITTTLGFAEPVDADQPLNEVGLDSLMSVRLSNSLEDKFGIPVPVADLISGPTINQLVNGVFRELAETITELDDRERTGATPIVAVTKPASQAIATRARAAPDVWAPAPAGVTPLKIQPGLAAAASGTEARIAVARSALAARKDDVGSSLKSILQQHITLELGFADAIDPDQALNELGLDSLRSVKLSNTLEEALGVPVPIAELIKGPTINQLVDHLTPGLAAVGGRIAGEHVERTGLEQHATNGRAPDQTAIAVNGNGRSPPWSGVSQTGSIIFADRGNDVAAEGARPRVRPAGEAALRPDSKWLIAPRPNPRAKARLFCFPFAGGGLASFRSWPELLGDSVEVVAVEPPGRGTRVHETPVDDLKTFVDCLLPEMVDWLDRPAAFFGHCLGGLTMVATLCALPKTSAQFIKYSFPCGVRPPHLLKRRGGFEDELVYNMMLHTGFDVRIPPYAQPEEIFTDIIRQFETPTADRMLEIPKLRKILLPTIRAEFGMAYNYQYRPIQPFPFPISSFVGNLDPWVSAEDSAGWRELTSVGFTNHVRQGSHDLMIEDREYILETIKTQFINLTGE
ncbi:MAG TPA: SDR family NAD(P)-dependent oxidoreductase [Xanthobacteraceae bacterium]|nr:SDR family NAD(P)-dependent oxidoreductase [Xanthobacteraceae bacterium]